MLVPTRNYSSPSYRYGFQGQEKDDEIKGEGNSLNYKFRMHDPRVGRFFAVDPLTKQYPWYTPYSFSGNKVIDHLELEGMEELSFKTHMTLSNGNVFLGVAAYTTDWYNDKAKTKVNAASNGVMNLANTFTPIRPLNPDEEKELADIGYLESYKKAFSNLKNIPSNMKKSLVNYEKTLEEGSTEDKIESTITFAGTIIAMLKGKGSKRTITGVATAGFKVSTKSLIGANQLWKCKQFAKDLMKNQSTILKGAQKIRKLEFKGATDFIFHNNKMISKSGIHQIIEVTTKKGVYIYDNLNIDGVLKSTWVKTFEIITKDGPKIGEAAMKYAKEIK